MAVRLCAGSCELTVLVPTAAGEKSPGVMHTAVSNSLANNGCNPSYPKLVSGCSDVNGSTRPAHISFPLIA